MSFVYKYCPSGRIGFLDDGLIRFTPPVDLNDPYECLPAFPEVNPGIQYEKIKRDLVQAGKPRFYDPESIQSEKIKRVVEGLQYMESRFNENPYFFEEFATEVNLAIANGALGILSLSRRWNSCLMWSHYTNTYSGFCVGFDRKHTYFDGKKTDKGHMHELTAVNYSKSRIIIPEKKSESDGFDVFLTKSSDWSYEEEERLLSTFSLADEKIEKKPYPIHLFKIPFEAFKEITIGHNADGLTRRKAVEAATRLGVPCYVTKVSRTTFDVERKLAEH
ncbi:DUF2971 domain-containing protein [Pseudomonas brenneri]